MEIKKGQLKVNRAGKGRTPRLSNHSISTILLNMSKVTFCGLNMECVFGYQTSGDCDNCACVVRFPDVGFNEEV